MTGVLVVFAVYAAGRAYQGVVVWDAVGSGTSTADFVDRNGLLPYLGALGAGLDLALVALAVVALVLVRRSGRPAVPARG